MRSNRTSSGAEKQLAADALARRLEFLIERFRVPGAMRWHFVLLLRQFLLAVISFSGDGFDDDEFDGEEDDDGFIF